MGSNLCCMKNSSISEPMPEPEEEEIVKRSPLKKYDHGDQITVTGNTSFKQCLLASPNLNPHPRCLVNGGDDVDQIKITRNSTLKQCLLASPNLNPHALVNGGELQVFPPPQVQKTLNSPQIPKRRREATTLNHHVLSSPEVQTQFFTPRLSFSSDKLGKLGKVDEGDDEEEGEVSLTPILRKSESGKLKKKVSFRFPEEADIYIFYSVKETLEEFGD